MFSATTSREDVESVRNLDSWRPSQSKSSRQKVQGKERLDRKINSKDIEKKIIAPPPTERLLTELPRMATLLPMRRMPIVIFSGYSSGSFV